MYTHISPNEQESTPLVLKHPNLHLESQEDQVWQHCDLGSERRHCN